MVEMVKSQNFKFSEAFEKFNNSSTSCDLARLSSHTPTKSKIKFRFHDDEAMKVKASLSKKMVFHDDDDTSMNTSSHTNLSSSAHRDESFAAYHVEEEEMVEEYIRVMNWTPKDKFKIIGRPNEYLGGYSPEPSRRNHCRPKDM